MARRLAARHPGPCWVLGSCLLLAGLPGFRGPGYASALLLGLLLPAPLGALTAREVSRRRSGEAASTLAHGLQVGALRGFLHAGLAVVLLVMLGVTTGLCEPLGDLTLVLLGPGVGLLLASMLGGAAGVLAERLGTRLGWSPQRVRLVATLLGLAGPLATAAWAVSGFYGGPSVFVFDPFVGFFAGTPYDTGFDPVPRLLAYRAGTLGVLLALAALARLRLEGHTWRSRGPDGVLLGAGMLLAVGIYLAGPTLGHRTSERDLQLGLGKHTQVGRCSIWFERNLPRVSAERLGRDCDAWLRRLDGSLGLSSPSQVTVYVFSGPESKEHWMGAGRTQIAKPWRREIYLNGIDYPHGVMGHELAHVVAGRVGQGPFRIAGRVLGLLPDPGLIEGLAMALAPDEDDDLPPQRLAAGLDALGRFPPLSRLFGLGFVAEESRSAYTVAGAFVDWVGAKYGGAVIRAWYGGTPLELLTGRRLASLEAEFRTALRRQPLSAQELALVSARFARRGVFSRRCPHAVDRALARADQAMADEEPLRACQDYAQAKRLDRSEVRASFGLGNCAAAAGQLPVAERALAQLASDASVPQLVGQDARERLADLALLSGKLEAAKSTYLELAAATLEVDTKRRLLVKAAARSGLSAQTLVALLVDPRPWDESLDLLYRWSRLEPNDALPDYLRGHNLLGRGALEPARGALEESARRPQGLLEVEVERLRDQVIADCAVHAVDQAREHLEAYLSHPGQPEPRRRGLVALFERCSGQGTAPLWPEIGPAAAAAKARRARPAGERGALPQKRASGADAPLVASRLPLATASPSASSVGSAAAATAASATTGKGSLTWDAAQLSCPSDMGAVAGGEFWVGSAGTAFSPEESPRFRTRVASFCLETQEVSVASYQSCVASGRCQPAGKQSVSCNARYDDRGEHPINCVTWDQSLAYCNSLGRRLPSEVEWEYAARGGAAYLKYPWGEASPDGRACWKTHQTCPGRQFGAGAYGLFDMSGNVWEWTSSDFGDYPFSAMEGETKVYRGGSWSRRFEKWMHLRLRNRWSRDSQGAHLGLRCAFTPSEVPCPFELDAKGKCRFEVMETDCPKAEPWNGQRCAKRGSPLCLSGSHSVEGHGCVNDHHAGGAVGPLDIAAVIDSRSPQMDSDCQRNQPSRPSAHRLSAGSHPARNAWGRAHGCKNRDVGVGWNSVCCP